MMGDTDAVAIASEEHVPLPSIVAYQAVTEAKMVRSLCLQQKPTLVFWMKDIMVRIVFLYSKVTKVFEVLPTSHFCR